MGKDSPAPRHAGPQVARVCVSTLLALQRLLDGVVTDGEREWLRSELEHLVEVARWNGESL
jgi:hypothetical protein